MKTNDITAMNCMQIRALISSKIVYVMGIHKQISFKCSKSNTVGSFCLTDEYTCHKQEGSDIWTSNKYFLWHSSSPCSLTLQDDRILQEKMQPCLCQLSCPLPRQQPQGDLVFRSASHILSLKQTEYHKSNVPTVLRTVPAFHSSYDTHILQN